MILANHFLFQLLAIFLFRVNGSQEAEQRLLDLEKIFTEKDAEIVRLNDQIEVLKNGEDASPDAKPGSIRGLGCGRRHVAFHAYLSTSRCYTDHQTIIFDHEETDNGGHYNNGNGIFTVPVNGTYVFTTTVGSNHRRYLQIQIVINGIVKGTAYADSDHVDDVHTSSATIVVHAHFGDRVLVRKGRGPHCSVNSNIARYALTTFSGWLLF